MIFWFQETPQAALLDYILSVLETPLCDTADKFRAYDISYVNASWFPLTP